MNETETKRTVSPLGQNSKTNSVTLKFSIPSQLYARLLSYSRKKGLKQSAILSVSIEKYLTENHF